GSFNGKFYSIETPGMNYQADSIVVATGGLSIPKLGASDLAYKIARQFKLKIVEPRPALVPVTLNKEESLFKELSGVATDVITRCDKTEFAEAALFTHKGLSGPAILQISSYWQHGKHINIDFLPERKTGWLSDLKKARPQIQLTTALNQHLPERLAETLAEKLTGDGERKLVEFKDADLEAMEQHLSNWQFNPNGTEGFAKAEVTIGGVSTDELSSKTMEAKKVPGLYFIGECVDVTGWLGGYNFQWAWSSGWVAGQSV
ncbi:MAG: aminoacetone oxidase family FAD-binding enzyme, partial [Pseudomonadota bacterium]